MLGDRWGVTDEEVARRYPCDAWAVDPTVQAWRGVTVHADTEHVWRWVSQIRLAPYSYDWIDNLGRRSPQELRGIADPAVGDPFTTAGVRRLGKVLAVQPRVHLTGRIAGVVISYVLVPQQRDTRLLMKLVAGSGRLVGSLLTVGDLVMARRQLLNLKRLAEAQTS